MGASRANVLKLSGSELCKSFSGLVAKYVQPWTAVMGCIGIAFCQLVRENRTVWRRIPEFQMHASLYTSFGRNTLQGAMPGQEKKKTEVAYQRWKQAKNKRNSI